MHAIVVPRRRSNPPPFLLAIAAARLQGETITVDFSAVSEQRPGPFNAGRNGGAVAAARIASKYLFSPERAVNEGDFRALRI